MRPAEARSEEGAAARDQATAGRIAPRGSEGASASPEGTPLLGVYVHWPFCASKCPYCDFNSHVRREVPQAAWREGLLAEARAAARLWPRQTLGQVFFGGGTPSLMPPETVAALLEALFELWPPAPDVEVTLECNPSDAAPALFDGPQGRRRGAPLARGAVV